MGWSFKILRSKDSQNFMAKIVSSTMNESKDTFQLDFKKYKTSLISESLQLSLAENNRMNKATETHTHKLIK